MSFSIRKIGPKKQNKSLSTHNIIQIIKQKTKKLAELYLKNSINKINIPILYINLDRSV